MKISRRPTRCEVPSVAMGDIAFNLLIFLFILAQPDDIRHLEWDPATTPKLEQIDRARVTITVDRDGKVYVENRQVSVSDIAAAVEAKLGNSPQGKRTVLLRIHKDTLAATFEPILEGVSQAGGEIAHVLEVEK